MQFIFLGAPGVGKGTMAVRYAERFTVAHISTGDLFRSNIERRTELGKKVEQILASGGLVPDSLTIDLVRTRLAEQHGGYILDGFPRTIEQAEALDRFATLDRVILFTVPEKDIIERLSGRRMHKPSGRIYHVRFNPPRVADRDDITGEPLITRPDDHPGAIRTRLLVYADQTAPLVDYYRRHGILVEIDARPSPDEVFKKLCDIVGQA